MCPPPHAVFARWRMKQRRGREDKARGTHTRTHGHAQTDTHTPPGRAPRCPAPLCAGFPLFSLFFSSPAPGWGALGVEGEGGALMTP